MKRNWMIIIFNMYNKLIMDRPQVRCSETALDDIEVLCYTSDTNCLLPFFDQCVIYRTKRLQCSQSSPSPFQFFFYFPSSASYLPPTLSSTLPFLSLLPLLSLLSPLPLSPPLSLTSSYFLFPRFESCYVISLNERY